MLHDLQIKDAEVTNQPNNDFLVFNVSTPCAKKHANRNKSETLACRWGGGIKTFQQLHRIFYTSRFNKKDFKEFSQFHNVVHKTPNGTANCGRFFKDSL
jgi:hypothetical protein